MQKQKTQQSNPIGKQTQPVDVERNGSTWKRVKRSNDLKEDFGKREYEQRVM